jgi:hypothetical protein
MTGTLRDRLGWDPAIHLKHTVLHEVVRHVADILPFPLRVEIGVGIAGGEAVGSRAMAAPAPAASASNALSFALGLNGLSFSMPMACMVKRSNGVKTSAGSSFTSWESI